MVAGKRAEGSGGKKSAAKKSAAKPKAEKKAAPKSEPKSEPVKPSEVRKMIPQPSLRTLLNTCKRLSGKASEITGELGQEISTAANRHNFNRKAFNVIRMLDKMEPEKLADFVDEFAYMMDASGLDKRAASVQRLELDDKQDGGDAADEGEAEQADTQQAGAETEQPRDADNIAPFKRLTLPPEQAAG